MKYNFYVKRSKEVDFSRILAETPDSVDAILICGRNALLLLRDSFLKRFDAVDAQWVLGENLSSCWGSGTAKAVDGQQSVELYAGNVNEAVPLNGWRATRIGDKILIDKALGELKAARAFVPKREVRVSYV